MARDLSCGNESEAVKQRKSISAKQDKSLHAHDTRWYIEVIKHQCGMISKFCVPDYGPWFNRKIIYTVNIAWNCSILTSQTDQRDFNLLRAQTENICAAVK